MPDQQSIAEAIRVRMDARRVDKKTGAEFAGMAYMTFCRSLAGDRPFTLPEFLRICGALNCSPDELLADIGHVA